MSTNNSTYPHLDPPAPTLTERVAALETRVSILHEVCKRQLAIIEKLTDHQQSRLDSGNALIGLLKSVSSFDELSAVLEKAGM